MRGWQEQSLPAQHMQQVQGFTYFEQHVFLVGSQVHLVLIVIHTQVDNVCQQLLVAINDLQLLLQRLEDNT